ncbi:hypothetical protein MIDIC_500019 [Alphaproteobacteria bacterium]
MVCKCGVYVYRCIVFDIKSESVGRKGSVKKGTEIREADIMKYYLIV